MKKTMFWVFACIACRATAGTVIVDAVIADEVRTREISMLPEAQMDVVIYYAFENDTRGLVLDSSPNGHLGAPSGWCVWSDNGPFNGGAMSFSNSVVLILSAPNFPNWNQYSVSVWFLHNGGGDHANGHVHRILDKTNASHSWHLHLNPVTGFVSLFLSDPSKSTEMGDGSHNYMDNTWHHLAVVRDGANGQLWVDGVMKDSVSNLFSVDGPTHLFLGNAFIPAPLQQGSWSGKLDEFMIFNRPLSPKEIQNLHQHGALAPHTPPLVTVTSDMVLEGDLTVSGEAVFEGGIRHVLPLGDLSSGIYTNAP